MSIREVLFSIKHFFKASFKKLKRKYFSYKCPETFILSDKAFLKQYYKVRTGKKLNLKNPSSYTEKLQWLKLYDRRPEYTMMVDKWAVRDYIKEKIGEKYLVPALDEYWENANDIDFSKLPSKCVLKCNHFSDVIIIKDGLAHNKVGKQLSSINEIKDTLNNQLDTNYFYKNREWPYKNVPRKIYAEYYMENTNGQELVDYKVFCINSKPTFVMVNSNRMNEGGVKVDMYDLDWKHMNMQDGHYPMAGDIFEKPDCFDEMINIASILCTGIPNIRVDFNYWNNRLYFGELTFYHSAGFDSFNPPEWDVILGNLLKLPDKKRKK